MLLSSLSKHVNTQFQKVKTTYVDKGYPVIIGEFGANTRTPDLKGTELEKHLKGRVLWHKDVAEAAKKYGVTPIIWDMGNENGNYDNMAYIRRQPQYGKIGQIIDVDVINALREVYSMSNVEGNGSIDDKVNESLSTDNKALHVSYKTIQSDTSEAGTVRINVTADWSQYEAVSFDMRIDGKSAGPCTNESNEGCNGFGWASVSLFNMSGEWDWKEISLGNVSDLIIFDNYKFKFGDGAGELPITDKKTMKAIGINVYGTQFTGDMYLDNFILWKTDGTSDTLQNFDKKLPEFGGIAKGKLIQANTTGDWGENTTSSIKTIAAKSKLSINAQNGFINAIYTQFTIGIAKVTLFNYIGQALLSKTFNTHVGENSIQLKSNYKGPAILVIQQNGQKISQKNNIKYILITSNKNNSLLLREIF